MTCEQKWKDLCLKRDQVDFIEGKIRSKLHTCMILENFEWKKTTNGLSLS